MYEKDPECKSSDEEENERVIHDETVRKSKEGLLKERRVLQMKPS